MASKSITSLNLDSQKQLHFMSVTLQGACHKTRLCHGLAFFFTEGLLMTDDYGRALILWEFHGWPPLHSWMRYFENLHQFTQRDGCLSVWSVDIYNLYIDIVKKPLTCSKYFGTLVEGHPTWVCYLSALGTAWLAQCHKWLCDHRHNILSVSGIFQSDCARSHTIIAAPFWRPWLAQFTAGVSSKHGLELKLSSNAVTTPYQQEDFVHKRGQKYLHPDIWRDRWFFSMRLPGLNPGTFAKQNIQTPIDTSIPPLFSLAC